MHEADEPLLLHRNRAFPEAKASLYIWYAWEQARRSKRPLLVDAGDETA